MTKDAAFPKADDLSPEDLDALFNRALAAHQRGDEATAERLYLELLTHRRDHPHTWTNLAVIRRKQRHMDAAAAMVFRAIDTGGQRVAVGHNLLNVLLSAGRAEDAMHIQTIDPFGGIEDARVDDEWRGRALKALGRPRAALQHYKRHMKKPNIRGELHTDLAISMLAAGQYEEGWAAYRRRWLMKGLEKPVFPMPEWDGEPLKGKSILFAGEQGLGDMIWLSRFLPALKARKPKRLEAVVRAPLVPLFESYGIFDQVHDRDADTVSETDYWLAGFDLPRFFWEEAPPAALPPKPSTESKARATSLLKSANGLYKIGIVWETSATSQLSSAKNCALTAFLPFSEIPGIQLVSLYKGAGQSAIKDIGAEGLIIDAGQHDRHFLDTAALIDELDLVITVDTAVAHLAGSQNKPVWMLTPEPAFWYWNGVGEATPYYPSMRVIRQSQPGQWDDVFARIHNDLLRMFA